MGSDNSSNNSVTVDHINSSTAAQQQQCTDSATSSSNSNDEFIKQLEEKLRLERRNIRLHKHPIKTLRLFGQQTAGWLHSSITLMITHPVVTFFALPLLAIWICLEHIPGPYTNEIDEIENYIKFIVWWLLLGILSSVGLGTGMHSGVLFLFPHIMKICLAAEACGTLDFESTGNTWLSENPRLFTCPDIDVNSSEKPSFFSILMKVYPACVLWGIGTAIGEIPPYAISKAAKLANKHVEQMDEINRLSDRRLSNHETLPKWDIITKMKVWMIEFLQQHGFLGVFLMSSWPNMAFDLCGICCGHFLMPFWTFFGATLLGKAGVKVFLQACFFTMLFTESALDRFVNIINMLTPKAWGLGDLMHNALVTGKAQFHSSKQIKASKTLSKSIKGSNGLASQLKLAWQFIMFAFIGLFAVSCIEQFAQMKAASLDTARIESLKNSPKSPNHEKSAKNKPNEGRLSPLKATQSTKSD